MALTNPSRPKLAAAMPAAAEQQVLRRNSRLDHIRETPLISDRLLFSGEENFCGARYFNLFLRFVISKRPFCAVNLLPAGKKQIPRRYTRLGNDKNAVFSVGS